MRVALLRLTLVVGRSVREQVRDEAEFTPAGALRLTTAALALGQAAAFAPRAGPMGTRAVSGFVRPAVTGLHSVPALRHGEVRLRSTNASRGDALPLSSERSPWLSEQLQSWQRERWPDVDETAWQHVPEPDGFGVKLHADLLRLDLQQKPEVDRSDPASPALASKVDEIYSGQSNPHALLSGSLQDAIRVERADIAFQLAGGASLEEAQERSRVRGRDGKTYSHVGEGWDMVRGLGKWLQKFPEDGTPARTANRRVAERVRDDMLHALDGDGAVSGLSVPLADVLDPSAK